MHELGIASEVLRAALAEAARHGATGVARVGLRVGVLRAVVPANLSFLFGHVAAGTIAEGAELEVEEEPVSLSCRSCGARSASSSLPTDCPSCGAPGVHAEGGDELRIVEVDLDVPDGGAAEGGA